MFHQINVGLAEIKMPHFQNLKGINPVAIFFLKKSKMYMRWKIQQSETYQHFTDYMSH